MTVAVANSTYSVYEGLTVFASMLAPNMPSLLLCCANEASLVHSGWESAGKALAKPRISILELVDADPSALPWLQDRQFRHRKMTLYWVSPMHDIYVHFESPVYSEGAT